MVIQVGWALSVTRILSQLQYITDAFLMEIMYRDSITIVDKEISRYRYFKNITIYHSALNDFLTEPNSLVDGL